MRSILVYLYANNLWPTEDFHFELLVKNVSLMSLLCIILQEKWYHISLVDFQHSYLFGASKYV